MTFSTSGQIDNQIGEQAAPMREHRNRVLKTAIASFADNSITVRCIMRDLTTNGAKLKVDQDNLLPNQFVLIVEHDDVRIDCDVVWRTGDLVGVRFAEPYEAKNNHKTERVQHGFERSKSILRRSSDWRR